MSESRMYGEPIAGGQAPRAWDELVIQFNAGIDLTRIKGLLQQARERVRRLAPEGPTPARRDCRFCPNYDRCSQNYNC